MSSDVHVRFCEQLGGKFPGLTRLVVIRESKEYLKELIHRLSGYLHSKLKLSLHPGKIYLQHYTKGVRLLGTVILPNRIYIANRTKGNFYNAIEKQNKIARDHSPCGIKRSFGKAIPQGKPTKEEQQAFQCSMNSYLGIMKDYKTYRLRKQMIF